jgi:serine/threonine protein kinase/tetratricopeptide (TPR) repeat protein
MIGETISHYRITDKLGAGGMGVVYRAQDLQLERFVALKFLPHDLALSESDRERFLREARSASALDHPNIGVIYGIDKTDDGRMFLVMAYYDGQTLSQKLTSGPLSLRQAMDWSCQIAAGLAAAHAHNIVHRDIKPSNIIIAKDNSARIVDFGLARVVATPSATMTGGTTGTLPYMSPEQILGEALDQRCDVWALSILLVQMVTGSHPFARDNTTAMTFAILNQPPAAIEALPALLQPIVLHGLAKDVAHRYPDAKEVLADLESARTQFTSSGIALDEPTLTQSAPSAALKQAISHASTPRWQAGSAAAQAVAAATGAPKARRIAPYFFVALAAVVLAAGSLLFPSVRQHAANLLSGTGGEKHVAVLPFDNIGNDPANEAVAEGLMDSLTSKLSNLDAQQQSLWVVPSSVVRSRKVTDPSSAGKDLGANLVVKGSIRRDAKNVELTVNLIDAKALRQLGSAVLDDATGDLAGLQDEAVARLARLMNINVTAEMLRATGGRATPAAYEQYLKALGLMQRYDKPGNLDQAVMALNDAVKTDPKFALGYASLGEAYRLKNVVDPNPRWIEQASAFGTEATRLDDRLASAYVTLGKIHEDAGQHELAVQEFQKALDLDRRNADALDGMAHAYENAGRLKDAEETFKKAVALRPDSWVGYNSLALFYDRRNRYEEGIQELKRAIELTPDNSQLYLNLGAFYLDTGDAKFRPEAENALKKSIQLTPSYPAYANLGSLYYDEQRYREAAALTEKALQLNDKNYLVWQNLVIAYQWMNDGQKMAAARERTISLLEQTVHDKPQDSLAHSILASLYANKKMADKAMSQIQTALALAPSDATTLENIAVTYESLGQREKAKLYLQKAVAAGYPPVRIQGDPELQELLKDTSFRLDGKQ